MAYKIKKLGGGQTEYTNKKGQRIVFLSSGKGASVVGNNRFGVPLGIAKGFTTKSKARIYLNKQLKRFNEG